ncbi:aspartic proteinase CDR1 [Prunus yedoensis var. nudiflora]|uniref:Aspartic proteinase CDR1 n=1 Tax=Prunus yedoensis var. nudiflora TaxID=2094558 RepID=A0A314ZJ55_PRUYE|nr:aspartic proteinase CDR1 [Prunus yedoensis var. nudiflora]
MASSTLIFSLFALILIITTIPLSMSSPVQGFAARLIHRDSPESPLYDPAATRAHLAQSARRRTIARQNYFNRLMSSGNKWGSSLISATLDQGHGDFIMQYKIGTPRVDTFGIFDTGSSLIWMQCEPCQKCYMQTIPIYDPAKSESYQKVKCGSVECSTTAYTSCTEDGECKYRIEYQDGSLTEGDIATEILMLEDDGLSGNVNLSNMVIGCGHYNLDTVEDYSPGVVGLSREPSSLVGQIGFRHVSYCIPSEDKGSRSSVKIGLPAVITEENTQTPMLSGKGGLYYLSLEGISIGGARLNIPRSVFDMTPEGDGGVIMDSGTSFTLIAPEGFGAVKQAVLDALSEFKPVEDSDKLYPFCYDDGRFKLETTPEIVFHFTRLDFPLAAGNTWIRNSQGHFCLAIRESVGNFNIFGLYQHRNANVGFDFNNNIVSLKYTDCQ